MSLLSAQENFSRMEISSKPGRRSFSILSTSPIMKKPRGKKSAWIYFMEHEKANYKADNANDFTLPDFTKQCGERWKILPEEEKLQFKQMAENDEKRYDAELSRYYMAKQAGEMLEEELRNEVLREEEEYNLDEEGEENNIQKYGKTFEHRYPADRKLQLLSAMYEAKFQALAAKSEALSMKYEIMCSRYEAKYQELVIRYNSLLNNNRSSKQITSL